MCLAARLDDLKKRDISKTQMISFEIAGFLFTEASSPKAGRKHRGLQQPVSLPKCTSPRAIQFQGARIVELGEEDGYEGVSISLLRDIARLEQ